MPNTSNDDVIIVGSLSDKELRDSIDGLVNYVGNQTTIMAGKFDVAMEKMKSAMKDFAITQKVSVDLMQDAWKQMSASFDAMLKAQQNATSSGNNSGAGGANAAQEGTIGWLREQSRLQSQIVDQQKIGTAEKQKEVDKHAAINSQLKEELKSTKQIQQETAKRTLKNVLSLPQNELKEAEYRLKVLLNTAAAYGTRKAGILSEEQWHKLNNAIAKTRQQIDKLQEKKPKSLKDVLGMDESSLDAITAKMRALKRVQIDPKNTFEVKQLGDAYSELQRQQAKLMGKNIQLTHSNNYLAQSFGYIRNRIVYALTLGVLSQFTKQVFAVRGEYEMLERSLGVLVNSFEKGSQIFQELNEMAIKSPFTLIELGTAAKQLTAYNFAAEEVVDTTRRLADISAALGVPMERLTYNLGQIKAQGVLNARDARDFANAGLAIVPMLAQMYTEQKRFGEEMVTTAQVYDMMSKKLVSYSDVLSVLYKITDEGGKFFDFQAKQAETLKVQMNNLTLAMNNMYNEIGASNQGLLVGTVRVTKKIFENWKTVLSIIQSLIVTYGAYKTILAIVNATHMRTWGARMIIGITQYINAIRSATGAMATFNAVMSSNAIVAFSSALLGVASYFLFFRQSVNKTTVDIERFGESGAKAINNIETLGRIINGVDENTSLYKKTVGELNQILREYGLSEIQTRDEINGKIEKTIELIKEESAARNRANMLAKGQETFTQDVKSANEELTERLTSSLATTGVRKELNKNVDIITAVIGDIVQEKISLIANKTGDEYEKGMKQIFDVIEERMRRIGISEKTIEQQLSYRTQFNQTNFAGIRQYISDIAHANQALDNYNNKVDANYRAAQKATQSTMSMAEKINYNANAMKNASQDAVSLYNRVYEIVKLAQQNHVINFDLKLTAQKPPKWMMNMDLPKLQELAARFTAIAQSGGHAKGYTLESTYERGLMYAAAARQKQYEEERKALEERNKKDSHSGNKKDDILDALKDEISLVKKLQSEYDKLAKSGVKSADAIATLQDAYGSTLRLLNKDLQKFGLPRIELSNILGKNPHEILTVFTELRNILESKGLSNLERMKAVEGVIEELKVSAKTYDMKKVTDGLNSELGKIKDEYELAIELDANPELGGIFADMMGLNKEQLSQMPKDFDGVVERLQKIIDNKLGAGKFNLIKNLNKASFDAWLEANKQGKQTDDALAKSLESIIDYANKVRLDSSNKQIEEWNKLLEKYAEYEYKVTQIQKEAERERETARKKGASQEILDSINNWEKQELARVSFEEFQKSPEWIVATGDLANMSKSAIGMLIEQLEKYKRSAKNLSPKQIKQLNSALSKLYKEQRKNNPFKAISNMLDEAKESMATFDEDIEKTQKEIDNLTKKKKESIAEGIADEETDNKLKKAIKRLKELKDAREKTGKVDASSWVSSINETIGAVQSAIGVFNDLAKAIGGVDSSDLDKVFSVVDKAGQGAAIGAQIGGGWGALIGAVAGAATGLISIFAGAANERITDKVEESERAVKRLELAYIDLQQAVDKAYGTAIIGTKQATLANKELQLAEIQRQIELEKSRSSKNRDEDKIIELQKEYKELFYEIQNGYTEIVDDLMGTDVASFAENLVSSMIDAFKQGEDYMQVFSDKFDEMIDNMIMKSIVSRVVSKYLDSIWEDVDKHINDRTTKEREDAAKAHNEAVRRASLSDDEVRMELMKQSGTIWNMSKITQKDIDDYRKAALAEEKAMQARLDAASAFTGSDVDYVMERVTEIMPELGQKLKDILGEYYKFGESSETQLSALQQGIQGVTEDTAGAIEGYMNIVAQRVFEQNMYLQEIRDHLNNFDLDVQLGTLSQMLLQLQQSYQVQQNIESILTGVLNPSGRAIVVELNS